MKEEIFFFFTCLEILIVHRSCFLYNTNLLWKTAFCAYSPCVPGPALPCPSSTRKTWGSPGRKLHPQLVVWEKAGSSATAA